MRRPRPGEKIAPQFRAIDRSIHGGAHIFPDIRGLRNRSQTGIKHELREAGGGVQ